MSIKGSVVLFSTVNLMAATTLSFAGFQGVRQLLSYGDCRDVCAYARIAFRADGLSDELLLVIILMLSVVHLLGGLSAINMSYSGLMIFMSAYVLRFLILVIHSAVKAVVAPRDWQEVLLMVDNRQTKIANDFRLCVTVIQLCLLFWSIALMVRFRDMANNRIKQRSLRMVLESWLLETKQRSFR